MSILTGSDLFDSPAAPSLLTAEEFCRRFADGRRELVRGVVKESPMPWTVHGIICALMARLLGNFVADRGLGRVLGNDTFFITRRSPDGVRGMDVAYISYARFPRGPFVDGPLAVAPELVVEVRSPSDLFAKVDEYLEAGVLVVVIVDADSRTVSTYRPGTNRTTIPEGGTLELPDVLPGFSVAVSALFE
ncbi:MAG: Uma2 family endonuclease [Gemmataceae bacterium]|nr:Uma2 family endonuclease [Gemmataceae bacterium]